MHQNLKSISRGIFDEKDAKREPTREAKKQPNGVKMAVNIASRMDIEYQSIVDAKINRKLIKNQAQNR